MKADANVVREIQLEIKNKVSLQEFGGTMQLKVNAHSFMEELGKYIFVCDLHPLCLFVYWIHLYVCVCFFIERLKNIVAEKADDRVVYDSMNKLTNAIGKLAACC